MRKLAKFTVLFLAAYLAITPAISKAQAQAQSASASAALTLYEPKLKAGLVYNFLKYTIWPQGAGEQDRLRVCLYGGDPFEGYLYPLRGRTAQQSEIAIVHVNSIPDTANCHFLFIHRREAAAMPQILAFLQGRQVLTASDIPAFTRHGGMVEFTMQNQRINVIINKEAVDRAGLRIHDRLLKLARLVRE